MSGFAFTERQSLARQVLSGSATHIALEGGSRSGKTFLFIHAICMRAMLAPKSRHAILRFRFNHVKASVIADTFPKVLELCFPHEYKRFHQGMDKTDWYYEWENGSQIWFGGLDDKQRTEKILGQEYVTVFLNEVSQIPKSSRDMAMTRLAQLVNRKIKGKPDEVLPLRAYYDLNPTNTGHWAYKLFHQKIDLETKKPMEQPDRYQVFQINPADNAQNLNPAYLDGLRSTLSKAMQARFIDGKYADENPNALFSQVDIDKWRELDTVPAMQRIVVGVDPSGAGDENNEGNDAIGIVVVGLGTDGNAYVLEDLTVKAGPATWGRAAVSAYDRHKADKIVGERNFGGEMVSYVVKTCAKDFGIQRVAFSLVNSSRGKHIRAEPFAPMYEKGQIRHASERMGEMEEELCAFSTSGYTGPHSPNRADALIFALSELFSGLTKPDPKPKVAEEELHGAYGAESWMLA